MPQSSPRHPLHFTAAAWLRHKLPAPARRVTLAVIAGVWCVTTRRHAAIAANLKWLRDPGERRSARQFSLATLYNYLCCQADVLALAHADRSWLLDQIDLGDVARIERARAGGRGVIVVMAHLGNPELAGVAMAAAGVPVSAFVEAINPRRDAFFAECRSRTGVRLIPVTAGASRAALRALAHGGVVVTIADRPLRARRINVPFVRGRRALPAGPAWLALQSGAPIITAHCVRARDATKPYRFLVDPEIPTTGLGPDALTTLTACIAERLGAAAAKYPDQWFVFDPEWQTPVTVG